MYGKERLSKMKPRSSYFQEVIEKVENLPPDDQMLLVEIIHQRLFEERRTEIAQNARKTLAAVRENRARFGSTEDLKRDLLDE
jgi:hypothetical protein